MQKSSIVAVLIGGLFIAPAAMAQSTNLAYATGEPRSELLIFLDKGNQLPPSANPMVSKAVNAALAGKTIHIVGRDDQAQVVKREMIREGAPANKLIVGHEPTKPLPKADSIGDTASRKVEIKF